MKNWSRLSKKVNITLGVSMSSTGLFKLIGFAASVTIKRFLSLSSPKAKSKSNNIVLISSKKLQTIKNCLNFFTPSKGIKVSWREMGIILRKKMWRMLKRWLASLLHSMNKVVIVLLRKWKIKRINKKISKKKEKDWRKKKE